MGNFGSKPATVDVKLEKKEDPLTITCGDLEKKAELAIKKYRKYKAKYMQSKQGGDASVDQCREYQRNKRTDKNAEEKYKKGNCEKVLKEQDY